MDYRYSKQRGFLNEAAMAADGAPSAAVSRKQQYLRPTDREALAALVPESVAREKQVVPLSFDGEVLTLAAVNFRDVSLADKLTFVLNRKVRLVPKSRKFIFKYIVIYYGNTPSESVDSMLHEFTETAISDDDADGEFNYRMTGLASASVNSDRSFKAIRGRRSAARAQGLSAYQSPESTMDLAAPEILEHAPHGFDPTQPLQGETGVFTYVVEEGQRVLVRRPDGTMEVIAGPRKVWKGRNVFKKMAHHVAHPGEFLIVRYRDGRQEHLPGPAEVWFDPRSHLNITREEGLQIAAKEAVVVYSSKEGTAAVQRRIEYGPTLFIPRPGEWLHTFSWHASKGGHEGVVKVPNGLVFQKLWLMPDQMYHDIPDVRTADDAVLTIRLMLFFELVDISRMLDATHDPIGDFTNAATSDVVDFTGRHDFESFKRNTDQLNEISTYRVLNGRAEQCGYRINKVVYRGYGAAERLQLMHDQAIEARTKLQLERATEQQAQDLENFQLDSQLARARKRRGEQTNEVEHDLELARKKQESELQTQETRRVFIREQSRLDAELKSRLKAEQDAQQREHLAALKDLGVDLTAYLTQGRADRVIELRGSGNGTPHVHLDPASEEISRATRS